MKNLILLLAVFLLPTIYCNAQTDIENPTRKGRLIGDVEFGFSADDIEQDHSGYSDKVTIKNNEFDVDLEIGYTVINNLSVGLFVLAEYGNIESDYPDVNGFPMTARSTEETNTSIMYGLFTKYYFLSQQLKPFLGAAAGLRNHKVEFAEGSDGYDLEGSGFAFLIEVGLAYFVNDNVGLQLSYNYLNVSNNLDGDGMISGFPYTTEIDQDNSSSQVNVGFIVAF